HGGAGQRRGRVGFWGRGRKSPPRRPLDVGPVPVLPAGQFRVYGRHRCHAATLRDGRTPRRLRCPPGGGRRQLACRALRSTTMAWLIAASAAWVPCSALSTAKSWIRQRLLCACRG